MWTRRFNDTIDELDFANFNMNFAYILQNFLDSIFNISIIYSNKVHESHRNPLFHYVHISTCESIIIVERVHVIWFILEWW